MTKLVLSTVANLQNEASAVATINNNSTATSAALENTLSRDGTSPNVMGANLDMNSFSILNPGDIDMKGHAVTGLPAATNPTDAVRYEDLTTYGGGNVLGPSTNHDGFLAQWNGANTKVLKDGVGIGTGLSVSGLNLVITNTAVTPATYGNSTHIPSFTVNQQGQITAASSTLITSPTSPVSTTLHDMVIWNATDGSTIADAPLNWNALAGASGSGQFIMASPGGMRMGSPDLTTVSNTIAFGGTATVGKQIILTLTYQNAAGVTRTVNVAYTPVGGDTTTTVATNMAVNLIAQFAAAPFSTDLAPFRLVNPGTVGTVTNTLFFNFTWLTGNHGTPTLQFSNNSDATGGITMTANGLLIGFGATASNPFLQVDTVATIGHVRGDGTTRAGIAGDNVWFDNYVMGNSAGSAVNYASMNVLIVSPTAGAEIGNLVLAGGLSTRVNQLNLSKGIYQNILGGGVPALTYFGAVNPSTAPNGATDLGLDTFANGAWGVFGDAIVGVWPANHGYAIFSHSGLDQSVATNYALVQGTAGDTLLNAATGQTLELRVGNVSKGTINATNNTFKQNTIAPSIQLSGTASLGFLEYPVQSSAPTAPSAGYRQYADSSGRLSWIRQSDGFTRAFDATLTANRVFTLPDATTTLVGNDATQTLTNKTISSASNTLTVGLTTSVTGVLPVVNGGTNVSAPSGTALDNITGFAGTGLIARTGAGAYSARTITGTATQISVSNGDGVAGNPTLSIPAGAFKSNIVVAQNATALVAGVTNYLGSGGLASSVNEATVQFSVTDACTLDRMFVNFDTSPSVGKNRVVTIRKNGVDTALTVTVNGTNTTGSDTTHTVAFAAGDLVSIKIVTDAASTTANGEAVTLRMLI